MTHEKQQVTGRENPAVAHCLILSEDLIGQNEIEKCKGLQQS